MVSSKKAATARYLDTRIIECPRLSDRPFFGHIETAPYPSAHNYSIRSQFAHLSVKAVVPIYSSLTCRPQKSILGIPAIIGSRAVSLRVPIEIVAAHERFDCTL